MCSVLVSTIAIDSASIEGCFSLGHPCGSCKKASRNPLSILQCCLSTVETVGRLMHLSSNTRDVTRLYYYCTYHAVRHTINSSAELTTNAGLVLPVLSTSFCARKCCQSNTGYSTTNSCAMLVRCFTCARSSAAKALS